MKIGHRIALLIVLVSSFLPAAELRAAERRDPLGLVCFLSGKVQMKFTLGKVTQMKLYDAVEDGTEITAGKGALVKIILFSGETYQSSGPFRLSVRKGAIHALRGRLEQMAPVHIMPQVALTGQQELPGRQMAASRVRGIGPWIMPCDQAEFSLPQAEKGGKYYVLLTDSMGVEVVSLQSDGPEITIPAGALVPGKEYSLTAWWRKEHAEKTLISKARLQTIRDEDARARKDLQEIYRTRGEVAVLLLAAEFDRVLGLHRFARQEYEEALSRYPDNPALQGASARFTVQE